MVRTTDSSLNASRSICTGGSPADDRGQTSGNLRCADRQFPARLGWTSLAPTPVSGWPATALLPSGCRADWLRRLALIPLPTPVAGASSGTSALSRTRGLDRSSRKWWHPASTSPSQPILQTRRSHALRRFGWSHAIYLAQRFPVRFGTTLELWK